MRNTKLHKALGLTGCIVMLTVMEACGTQEQEADGEDSIVTQEDTAVQDTAAQDAAGQELSGQDIAAKDGSAAGGDKAAGKDGSSAGEDGGAAKSRNSQADGVKVSLAEAGGGTSEEPDQAATDAGKETLDGHIKSTEEGSFVMGVYHSYEGEDKGSTLVAQADGNDPEVKVIYTEDAAFTKLHILASDGSDGWSEKGTAADLAAGTEVVVTGRWETGASQTEASEDGFIADQIMIMLNEYD